MDKQGAKVAKGFGIGCLAVVVILIGIIILGLRSGYLRVVQDLSSGRGDDSP